MHRILNDLFRGVLAMGGAISGEHGIGLAKRPWWHDATTSALRELHRKIKKTFDPRNLLNPGKYLG
jgi:glycolate oxidase